MKMKWRYKYLRLTEGIGDEWQVYLPRQLKDGEVITVTAQYPPKIPKYKVEMEKMPYEDIESLLDEWGDEGWELVGIVHERYVHFFFKRPLAGEGQAD
jgi:hypothetical protein